MTAIIAPNHAMVLQLKTEKELHAFDLSETFRVAVGRHHSNDIQLRSRRVSSYHAEILTEVDGLFLRDMGSTNGTYVNDQAVRRAKLSSGDSIRIGEFTLSVLLVPRGDDSEDGASVPADRFSMGTVGSILAFGGSSTSSSSGEERRTGPDAPLPELLTELSRRSGSALISIRIPQEAKILLREGAVIHCEYGAVRGQKALYRLLTLTLSRGTYEIQELPAEAPRTIHQATDDLVVEGMQQLEALDKLVAKLPPMTCEVALDENCGIPVNTLTADELETYQQLIRYRTVARVLEESAMTDFMVLFLSHALLEKGFFKAAGTREAQLEETVIKGSQ